ncbi:hypothetical protein HYALB_00013643 [Hymenoscyphus albidus]|uniref:Uncharacterized protein n=1 Tax=Hymenoscyphus albidus TaxID=595503 RepID=A0A9N9LSH9_9HELO|nr:hypothetical protein HYALB_00013643 [Hymenoscyphus albidus]
MVVYVTTTSGTKAAVPRHVPFLTTFGIRPISFRPSALSQKFIDLYFTPRIFLAIIFLAMYSPVELTEHWEELREEIEKMWQEQRDNVEWWYVDKHWEELGDEIEKMWQEQRDNVEWWYVDSRTSATHNSATGREGTGAEPNEQSAETHKTDEETVANEKSATQP